MRGLLHEAKAIATWAPRYARQLYYQNLHERTGKTAEGTRIYDEPWDVLILLDACRVDALESVADDYDFLESIGTFRSLGSSSQEWMEANFDGQRATEQARTVMVTGNPFSSEHLDPDAFAHLEEVWRYSWDDDSGTIRPGPITDAAVQLAEEHDHQRLVVHYMQPHYPFVASDLGYRADPHGWGDKDGGPGNNSVWYEVSRGEVDPDVVWDAYIANLRYVLDAIQDLLDALPEDADVVISADHGNAFGEHGLYGHPDRVVIDALRDVPWVHTTGRGKEYEPTPLSELRGESVDASVSERLQELGYTE